jgi:hypothetical protein
MTIHIDTFGLDRFGWIRIDGAVPVGLCGRLGAPEPPTGYCAAATRSGVYAFDVVLVLEFDVSNPGCDGGWRRRSPHMRSSHQTLRWREPDSNPRSPVCDRPPD